MKHPFKPISRAMAVLIFSSFVNPSSAQTQHTEIPLVGASEQTDLTVPAPSSGLPYPYEKTSIQPRTPEDDAYTKYLRSIPMFPDKKVCDKNLSARFNGLAKPGSMKRVWVTEPFLAWGGKLNGGVVVGPIERLFTIIEAHVGYRNSQGQDAKATFSCFVQYARFNDRATWQSGQLKYGSYMQDGFKKYASGPAVIFTAAPPGIVTTWDPKIRYYSKD